MREGDKYTSGDGVQLFVSAEGNFSLAGTGVNDEADMEEFDSDEAGSVGSGGSFHKPKPREVGGKTTSVGLQAKRTGLCAVPGSQKAKQGKGAKTIKPAFAKFFKDGDSPFEDLAKGSPSSARETGTIARRGGASNRLRINPLHAGGGLQTSADELSTGACNEQGEGPGGLGWPSSQAEGDVEGVTKDAAEGESKSGKGGVVRTQEGGELNRDL